MGKRKGFEFGGRGSRQVQNPTAPPKAATRANPGVIQVNGGMNTVKESDITETDIAEILHNAYNPPSICPRPLKMFPGYSGLIQYGHCPFLAMTLGFALLLNIFLVANFYWTALITANQRNILLVALFGVWVALTMIASFWKQHLASIKPEERDETFRQTICHYLRGDWFAAESQILPYVKKYPKDIEMLLLQATMYRHTERYEEALVVLDKLQLLQNSRHWYTEIETERAMITATMRSSE